MAERRRVQHDVLRFMSQAPGQSVFLGDMMADLNLTARQVQNGVLQLIGRGEPIDVKQNGRQWVYVPNRKDRKVEAEKSKPPADLGELYVLVGYTKDQSPIVRSEAGRLYKTEEL